MLTEIIIILGFCLLSLLFGYLLSGIDTEIVETSKTIEDKSEPIETVPVKNVIVAVKRPSLEQLEQKKKPQFIKDTEAEMSRTFAELGV